MNEMIEKMRWWKKKRMRKERKEKMLEKREMEYRRGKSKC